MKSCKKLILFVVMLLSTLGMLVGCTTKNKGNNSENPTEAAIAFAEENIQMTVADERTPDLEYTGGEGKPTFVSNDETIVSVDETGKLTALKQGTAVITATYAGKTDTLTVVSSFGDLVPLLRFDTITEDEITITRNDVLNVNAYVFFNGKTFEDMSVSYTVTSGATVDENNIFSATDTGEYQVSLKASWRNYGESNGLIKQLTVKVIDVIEVYVNDNSTTNFVLYTRAEFEGETFTNTSPFEIVAKLNGEAVTPNVNWISGEDCVEYADNVITGVKSGKAVCDISYGAIKQTITVDVRAVYAEYQGEPILFSTLDGTLPLTEIFGEDVTLISVMDSEGNEYPVTDNKITGITVTKDGPTMLTLTACSESVGYTMDVIAYTKVIRTQEDLQKAFQAEGRIDNRKFIMPEFDGYYLLANDITANSTVHSVLTNDLQVNKSTTLLDWAHVYTGGLTGTFDGNGHTIDGLTIQNYGLFGMINGGTVKNVNLKNIKLTATKESYSRATLAYSVFSATIENVNIEMSQIEATGTVCGWRAVAAIVLGGSTKMTNCIFTCDEIQRTDAECKFGYGSLFCYDFNTKKDGNTGTTTGHKYTFTNVYVVSPYVIGVLDSNLKDLGYVFDTEEIDVSTSTLAGIQSSTNAYQIDYLKRYDNVAEMKAANNDYTAFVNSGYWQLDDNGLPIWKN